MAELNTIDYSGWFEEEFGPEVSAANGSAGPGSSADSGSGSGGGWFGE